MWEKIKALIQKYNALIRYGIFGVITTIINIVTYALCYHQLGMGNIVSNVIAWILSVLVAFVTNKLWVFDSKTLAMPVVLREMVSFFGCRIATGFVDMAIMYVTVDLLAWNANAMKCISNVIVIVINYVASKLLIFRKEKT